MRSLNNVALLQREGRVGAQTASSRQRNLVPATEAKRTVGGRDVNHRSQALPEGRLERLRWFVLAFGDERETAAIHHRPVQAGHKAAFCPAIFAGDVPAAESVETVESYGL
jgi:hypothetical protein